VRAIAVTGCPVVNCARPLRRQVLRNLQQAVGIISWPSRRDSPQKDSRFPAARIGDKAQWRRGGDLFQRPMREIGYEKRSSSCRPDDIRRGGVRYPASRKIAMVARFSAAQRGQNVVSLHQAGRAAERDSQALFPLRSRDWASAGARGRWPKCLRFAKPIQGYGCVLCHVRPLSFLLLVSALGCLPPQVGFA